MNIDPNNEGWSFDESIGWKLVHNRVNIIFFENTDKSISTQETLFIGTEQECINQIESLNLTNLV
jgi:hypothetical protein